MSYDSEVLADAPRYYYKTNEASGTILDSSGGARSLTLPGGSPNYAQAGPVGLLDAMTWPDSSGATEYYAQSSATLGATSTALTIECWFYYSGSAPAAATGLCGIGYGYSNTSDRPALLWLGTDGKIHLWWGSSVSSGLDISSASGLSTGWHHAVGVLTSTTGKIRLDKVDVASGSHATSIDTSGLFFIHGGGNGGGGSLPNLTNGSPVTISKPAAYRGVSLSDARIDAHYDAMFSANATASLTLTGSAAGVAATSAGAALALSGEASLGQPATAAADLTLAGSAFSSARAAGTANLTLAGAGAASARASATASLTLTGVAEAFPLYGTDTSNQFSGLSMGGLGLVFVTPGVAEPPFALGPQRVEKAIAFPPPTLVKGRPIFENTVVEKAAPKDQIIMDGRDITWFRADAPGDTPLLVPGYELTEPLAYGASDELRIKRTHFTEIYGEGDLSFLFQGARVQYRRVTAEGDHTIDYRGIVFDVRPTQDEWVVGVVGEISGRASQILMQHPLVRKIFDIGAMVKFEVLGLGFRMSPHNGPHTGIRYPNFGGMTLQSYFQRLGALARTKHTNARAVMPKVWGQTTLEFREIDTETIDFTIWPDGYRVDPSGLRDDLAEKPNTIFGNGVTPEGLRWGNNKYPGYFTDPQPYPMNDNSNITIGMSDDDTDTGTGITTLVFKLAWLDYLDDDLDDLTTYTSDVADAVNELKEDAGLPQDGVMDLAAWNALYDVDVVGYNPQGARKFPIAQDPRVNAFLYSANGSIIGRNPDWVQGTIRVDREYDFGQSNKSPAIWNARSNIRLASGHQWFGDLVLNDISVFAGDRHTYEIDSFTAEDLMPARDIRPGMNGKIMYFDGSSTHVHVSGVKVGAADEHGARSVNLTVDTGGRDFFDLAAALDRNRETARSPYREWISHNRANRPVRNMIERDEWFGRYPKTVELKGGQWNEIPVIMGQQGMVNETDLRMTIPTTFAYLVATRELGELWMGNHFGNPWSLDEDGLTVFEQDGVVDLFDDKTILTLQGAGIQRAGFGWRHGYNEDGDRIESVPMTGTVLDRQAWGYATVSGRLPVVWLSIYPEDDCSIIRGRWFSAALDDLT